MVVCVACVVCVVVGPWAAPAPPPLPAALCAWGACTGGTLMVETGWCAAVAAVAVAALPPALEAARLVAAVLVLVWLSAL